MPLLHFPVLQFGHQKLCYTLYHACHDIRHDISNVIMHGILHDIIGGIINDIINDTITLSCPQVQTSDKPKFAPDH